MLLKTIIILTIVFFQSVLADNGRMTARKVLKLMGTRFEIIAVHEDEKLRWQSVDAAIAEIRRIESLISSWDSLSQTSAINRAAGKHAVQVDDELFGLIRRSKKISDLTGGVFDISYASLDRIWKFDGSMTDLPAEDTIRASVSKIGYQNIILDKGQKTVFLKKAGMKIGFGAIGKGFAANRARALMLNMGIKNGVVNAAGDLIAWGKDENGEDWKIAITNPNDKTNIFSWLNISGQAVVTSGNYEKFVEMDGKRYSHIINPKTGMPVSGVKSVTVVCPDAELADALATSVFILGVSKGITLIDKLKNVECLVVDDHNKMVTSKNLELD